MVRGTDANTAAHMFCHARASMQGELQQAQAEQQQLRQHRHHPTHPPHSTAAGCWPAYDAAVQQLKQQSDSGQLPGRLYGRLCNVLFVTHPIAATAVNAALAEAADLNRTLLVSDRQTAAAVIDHFRHNRIGTVQCRILSDAPTATRLAGKGDRSGVSERSGSSSIRPLLDFVAVRPDAPELEGLLQQLLGSWLLVEHREAAIGLLHLRKNLVTR